MEWETLKLEDLEKMLKEYRGLLEEENRKLATEHDLTVQQFQKEKTIMDKSAELLANAKRFEESIGNLVGHTKGRIDELGFVKFVELYEEHVAEWKETIKEIHKLLKELSAEAHKAMDIQSVVNKRLAHSEALLKKVNSVMKELPKRRKET